MLLLTGDIIYLENSRESTENLFDTGEFSTVVSLKISSFWNKQKNEWGKIFTVKKLTRKKHNTISTDLNIVRKEYLIHSKEDL